MNPETDPVLPESPVKAKHNKLELPDQFRLLDWCRNNEDKVKTLADTQLAEIAAAELGIKITPSNITSTRQAAKIEKLKPATPPTVEERVKRLEMTLGTFITWSQQHLGESGALALLKLLSDPTAPAAPSTPPLPGLETSATGESPQPL